MLGSFWSFPWPQRKWSSAGNLLPFKNSLPSEDDLVKKRIATLRKDIHHKIREPSKVPPFYTAGSSTIPVVTHFHTLEFCPKNQHTSPRTICYLITEHFWGSVPHKGGWRFLGSVPLKRDWIFLGVSTPEGGQNIFGGFSNPQGRQKCSGYFMGYWPPKMSSNKVANSPWWGALILRAEV